MSESSLQIPPVALPEVVPIPLPRPKFQLGDSVFWSQVPDGDFGRIIGIIYTHEASVQATGFHYLVLLESHSPSHAIVSCDFAFEEDLQPLPALFPQQAPKNRHV